MKINPNVVEQNRNIDYTLTLKNSSNIESIEIFSKSDCFHLDVVNYKIKNNTIYFTYSMAHIGEFVVKINFTYKESKTVNLYCLDKDMIKLKPLKGDLHMHTIYSDGKRTPLAMCISSMESGMDFISITDHDNYNGSLQAIKKVKDLNLDILVLPGEEVTVGESNTSGNGHMLSINSNKSIDEQRQDSNIYEKEVIEIVKDIENNLSDNSIDPLVYAKNIWVINKIKEANGISILCHPKWLYHNAKYHLHQPIYKEILKNSRVDGIEVVGDIDKIEELNNMTYLTYMEIKNKHKYLAPIANSDAHDSDHYTGERFTIVFAKEKTDEGIVEAIRDGNVCAILKRGDQEHQYIGNSDLAHYAYFLIQEYFPKHKKLRNRLAKLYLDELIDNQSFKNKIDNTKDRLQEHFNNFFAN